MASGTVQFQSATLATPAANLAVMADSVNDSDHGAGTAQYIKVMDGATGGTAKASVTTANGMSVDVTRVQGTVQALGSIQGVGTFQVLGSVQGVGTFQVLGSVQSVGTSQALGTFQPLAGSVHLASGTVQVLGSVQGVGTFQALGTFQPLAGSVHLAAGSVNAQGVIAHGAVVAGNPLLISAFGSSGTQAAVADGQLSRLWSDLNGRLQVRGTIDSIPSITVSSMPTTTVTGTVQTHGTSQVLGSVQTVGTSQVLGSVQTVGTSQVLGSVQGVGTFQVLGSVQAVGTTQTKDVRTTASAVTSVAAALTDTVLLALNTGRFGAAVYAEGPGTLFLKLGNAASTVSYTAQLTPQTYYEVPFYWTGSVNGIWGTASGTARITEIT